MGAKEAARLLNISERLLWTYTNAGEVPHIRIGRRVLYGLTQLDAWLADRTKGGSRA